MAKMKTQTSHRIMEAKSISFSLILILTFTLQTYASSPDNKSFRQGNKLILEEKFNQALPIWLSIVEDNPVNYSACFKLGLCYFHMDGREANEIPYFRKTLDHTTKD